MADVFITDITEISEVDDSIYFVGDNGADTYKIPALKLKEFLTVGNMAQAVYDPQGKEQDIFAYAEQLVENIEPSNSGINPNLLDNWYFGNPVNQRGLTEYIGTTYSVDRWLVSSANTVLRVDEFSFYNIVGGNAIVQYIDNQDEFTGKIVTISALANNVLISATIEIPDVLPTGTSTIGNGSNLIDGVAIYLRVLNGKLAFVFYAASNYIPNTVIKVKAAKLELGNTQTLAHQNTDGNWVLNEIPNYADQLARCQRYFQIFRTETERKTYCEDFRPTMRVTNSGEVAKSTVTINGVTYYTATADL